MDYEAALRKIKKKVISDFAHVSQTGLFYHTLDRTKRSVFRAQKISHFYKLNPEQHFILLAATWFHELNYLYEVDHAIQPCPAKIAVTYLRENNFDDSLIKGVDETITKATGGNSKGNMLAEILRDVDFYDLGKKRFFNQIKLIKQELEGKINMKIPKKEWQVMTLDLLLSNQFQTGYCFNRLHAQLQINIHKVIERLQAFESSRKSIEAMAN